MGKPADGGSVNYEQSEQSVNLLLPFQWPADEDMADFCRADWQFYASLHLGPLELTFLCSLKPQVFSSKTNGAVRDLVEKLRNWSPAWFVWLSDFITSFCFFSFWRLQSFLVANCSFILWASMAPWHGGGLRVCACSFMHRFMHRHEGPYVQISPVLEAVPSVKRLSSCSEERLYPYNVSVLCIKSALKFCKHNFLVSHQSGVVKKCWFCSSHLFSATFALTSAQASSFCEPFCFTDLPDQKGHWSWLPVCVRAVVVLKADWEKCQRQKSGQSRCKIYLAAALLTVTWGVTYWCCCLVTSQGADKTELVKAREETFALCSSVVDSWHLQDDAGRDFAFVPLVSRCWSTPGFWLLHCSKSGLLIESENPEKWEWLLLGTWTSLNRNFTAR